MTYSTPGVYVEESTSTSQPIIGVETTTPVFIGFFPVQHKQTMVFKAPFKNEYEIGLNKSPVVTNDAAITWFIYGKNDVEIEKPTLTISNGKGTCKIKLNNTGNNEDFSLDLIYLAFDNVSEGQNNKVDFQDFKNFKDFQDFFGDYTMHQDKMLLAHAVLGFFRNGGTRCYVGRGKLVKGSQPGTAELEEVLRYSEYFDDISLVIPIGGNIDVNARNMITEHCHKMKDRFAIFHFDESKIFDSTSPLLKDFLGNDHREKAAVYHPWLKVFDEVTRKDINVPPSGHVAGIYSRVDAQQGVQKAPANEVVNGVNDVSIGITKEQQDSLNPVGINCIRLINGRIKVWGARTLSINNINYRYINVCRSFMFLSESIEKGTHWAVFQPNTIALRQQIVRNITDFLLNQWRAGMLFGETQQEAFSVQCDAETNSNADQGQLKAIVKVALVRPAEFIVIQISHKQAS
jgi:phage tail sheath protein FI